MAVNPLEGCGVNGMIKKDQLLRDQNQYHVASA